MSLRDLDARLVPRLAALLRSLLDGLAGRREALAGSVRSGGSLRRLDERFASRGPLKLLRDVPQLGLLVVAAVFLGAAGAALALNDPGRQTVRAGGQGSSGVALSLSLGPAVGDEIDAHFVEALERAQDAAEDDPDAEHLALVSLREGLTPEQVGRLLQESEVSLERAYLRAPVGGNPEEILFQTPGDAVTGLRQVFGQIAERKAQEQRDLLTTAATISAATPQEAEFKALYERDAVTAAEEAAAYRTGCGCVFALVVRGPAQVLADLPGRPVVRGVELAPRGAEVGALDVRPLGPDEEGVVAPRTGPESDGP